MSINYINIGSSPNKGDGDTLRTAFRKINENFAFLSTASGFLSTGSSTVLNISPTAPSTGDGTLWFNSTEARTYVKYNGAWVDASPQITPPPSTSTEETTVITMSSIPPTTGEGSLWFNINDARTYINYSGAWVDTNPQITPPPILPANDIGVLANDGNGNLYWTTASITQSTGSSVDLLSVESNILPADNLAYDLGSLSKQWRSLYVGTSTIYIGGVPLTLNTANNTLVIGTSTGAVNLASEDFVTQQIQAIPSAESFIGAGSFSVTSSDINNFVIAGTGISTSSFSTNFRIHGSVGGLGVGVVDPDYVKVTTGSEPVTAIYLTKYVSTDVRGFVAIQEGPQWTAPQDQVTEAMVAYSHFGLSGVQVGSNLLQNFGPLEPNTTYTFWIQQIGTAATEYVFSTDAGDTGGVAPTAYSKVALNPSTVTPTTTVIGGELDPVLNLKRGYKYTFNVETPGHSFWIMTTSTYNITNAYTHGVTNNGTGSGILSFVVPGNAPDRLYYMCPDHPAMAGVINITNVDSLTQINLSAVDQNIVPAGDRQYDLGSPTNQWRSLYVSTGTIFIGGVPLTINTTSNTLVIGTSTNSTASVTLATEEYVIGSRVSIVNVDNSLTIDSSGNAIFQGDGAGNGVNRGLEWDYGAEQDNGTNSTVRQDNSGLSVKAWTTGDGGGADGGGENGYSATVNIRTNQGDNEKWWVFDGAGALSLPAGGTITEGIVTDNPTIQLTPADPDVASQKLVIKGGNAFFREENDIGLGMNTNVWAVGDTVTIDVYSMTNAGQTLYWWIYPEVGQGQITDPGFGTVTLDESGYGQITFELDSDDYEFTVRVSTIENVYGEGTGVESVTINDGAGIPDLDLHHLHLTTGDLQETSIFLGTDDHNVRTKITGDIEITARDYDAEISKRWQFKKDGELVLPEDTGGDTWAALNGPDPNDNSDTEYRAVAVGPDGAVYAGGRRDGYPTITKIEADGDIVYSKAITVSGEGPVNGRINSVEYAPVGGTPLLLVTFEIYPNYTQSVVVGLNPDTGELAGEFATAFGQADADFYITEAVTLGENSAVFVGSKSDSFVDYPVTAQTGSTTGTIIVNRTDFPLGTVLYSGNSDYQISGTGFASPESFSNVNFYTGLTGTVREGSGAVFTVQDNGNGTYGGAVTSAGTNYLPGHKILVLGSALGGVDSTNDATIEVTIVDENGGVTGISISGTAAGGATSYNLTGGVDYPISVGSEGVSASQGPSSVSFQRYVGWTNTAAATATQNLPIGTEVTFTSGVNTYIGTIGTIISQELVTEPTSTLYGITWASGPGFGIEFVPDSVSFTIGSGLTEYTGLTGTNYQVGSGLQFDLSYFSMGYADGNTSNYNGGLNYVAGDVITISGASLGGTTPTNNMTITVNTVGIGGVITGYAIGGVAQTATWKIETLTPVDFTAEGSWEISISYARENFLSTFVGNSIFFGLGNIGETDRLYAVAADGTDIYAIGESYVETENDSFDAAVIYKFSVDPETSAFTFEWARVLNDWQGNHEGKSVAVASDGVYVTMVGYGEGTYTGLVKLDKATGDILWKKGTESGDDSSVAVDPDTGLIWIAIEGGYYDLVEDDAIKLIAFDSTGTVQDRRWLARTGDDLYFKNGRCLRISGDHIVVVGYSQTEMANTPFVFRVPKAEQAEGFTEGDFLLHNAGDYSVYDLEGDFSYTVSPQIYEDTTVQPSPISPENILYETFTDERTVEEFGLVKSAIVFSDGTRMETAPVQEKGIPQNDRSYDDYTLTLADNGKHIFHPGNGYRIYVPAHEQLALPIGYTVTLITKNDGNLNIEAPDYYDINNNQYYAEIVGVGLDQQSRYWSMPQRSIATLIKVEEGLWYLSGPGLVNED